MITQRKPLYFISSSRKDLAKFPTEVRKAVGYALHFAQCGKKTDNAKALQGFGGAGVLEVIEGNESGTYRAVYTVKFGTEVYVLHCFQKKSKSGIKTPEEEIKIVRERLKIAEAISRELMNEKNK